MIKPFAEIQTDAEYLRAVGMGPDTHPNYFTYGTTYCPDCDGGLLIDIRKQSEPSGEWGFARRCDVAEAPGDFYCTKCKPNHPRLTRRYFWLSDLPKSKYVGPELFPYFNDPTRKWDNLANVLRVLGPEMDRRGWWLDMRTRMSYGPDHARIYKDGVLCAEVWNDLPHIALLEAFYNAHAQGDNP